MLANPGTFFLVSRPICTFVPVYRGSFMSAPFVADIEDLNECSCFIEFIKQVEEKR